jgi:hypothetical protein
MSRRARRRAKPNVSDELIDVGAGLASVLLFAMGAHRFAGAVATGNGLWQLSQGRKISAAFNIGIGSSFLLWPNWPSAVFKKSSTEGAEGVGAQRQLPPTRDSCIECVEKHLGSAAVLITETRNGYPHRMLAIGHLHEAEDESQHWPALHEAIRMARKRYQQTDIVPDFAALSTLAAGARGMR